MIPKKTFYFFCAIFFCLWDTLCVYCFMYTFIYSYLFLPIFFSILLITWEFHTCWSCSWHPAPPPVAIPLHYSPQICGLFGFVVVCLVGFWYFCCRVFVFLSSTVCVNHTLLNVWPLLCGERMVMHQGHTLQWMDSPFPRSFELPIVARLGMEPCATSRVRNLWLHRPEALWKDHDYYSAKWTQYSTIFIDFCNQQVEEEAIFPCLLYWHILW